MPSVKTHSFIQFTPIQVEGFNCACGPVPQPKDLPKEVSDNVLRVINEEVAAFMEWSGVEREEIAMDMFAGLPTVFLFLATRQDIISSEKDQETIGNMINELSYCAKMGDTGTRLAFKGDIEKQSFKSRCRWEVPLNESISKD